MDELYFINPIALGKGNYSINKLVIVNCNSNNRWCRILVINCVDGGEVVILLLVAGGHVEVSVGSDEVNVLYKSCRMFPSCLSRSRELVVAK